jgi:hypothetical protein
MEVSWLEQNEADDTIRHPAVRLGLQNSNKIFRWTER